MIEGRDFAAASTVGARGRQEDDWGTHVNPPAQEESAKLLATVADGMGGMPAGDRASSIALRTFMDSYAAIRQPTRERLRHALAHANREIGIAVEAEPEFNGMGCTLVAALFFCNKCEWLSIGDSFVLRYRDGRLEHINPLHIYAKELDEQVKRGEITAETASNHPDRAALTSVIQGTVLEEVAQGELQLVAGDVVLLASDGILTLSDEEIATICMEHIEEGAGSISRTIIRHIDAKGLASQDNATVVIWCPRVRQSTDDEVSHVTGVDLADDVDENIAAIAEGQKVAGRKSDGEVTAG